MAKTTQIPRGEWSDYFDNFTRQHVRNDRPDLVTLEVLSPRLGDQVYAQNARLLGLSFDPHSNAFEVLLDGADHMTFNPAEIWVLEGDADAIAVFELVHADGTKQLIHVKEGGPLVEAERQDDAGSGTSN
jgi:hypothetical protein